MNFAERIHYFQTDTFFSARRLCCQTLNTVSQTWANSLPDYTLYLAQKFHRRHRKSPHRRHFYFHFVMSDSCQRKSFNHKFRMVEIGARFECINQRDLAGRFAARAINYYAIKSHSKHNEWSIRERHKECAMCISWS